MRVAVFGGSGLAGSSIARDLRQSTDYEILSPTSRQVNLLDSQETSSFIDKYRPDIVVNSAGRVGGIQANIDYEFDFLSQNWKMQDNLVTALMEFPPTTYIFLGSSCIYPKNAKNPISESDLMSGFLEKTNEGYALAKIAGVKGAELLARTKGVRTFSLMPSNLIGDNDNFHRVNSHVVAGLMSRMHEAKLNECMQLEVWGSGKPLREFLHSDDLASAVSVLLANPTAEGGIYNVGSGEEISIHDLALEIQEIVDFKGRLTFDRSKPDGVYRKLLDSSKMRMLGWRPSVSLREGIERMYLRYLESYKNGSVRSI